MPRRTTSLVCKTLCHPSHTCSQALMAFSQTPSLDSILMLLLLAPITIQCNHSHFKVSQINRNHLQEANNSNLLNFNISKDILSSSNNSMEILRQKMLLRIHQMAGLMPMQGISLSIIMIVSRHRGIQMNKQGWQ